MPQLPSGRHVAVDPEPLTTLTRGVASPYNAHHLMAIEELGDLFRWLDILVLAPTKTWKPAERERARAVPGAPAGFVGVPTSFRLADWRSCAGGWSEEDRAAMLAFIDERVRPWLHDDMELVRRCQKALRESPQTPAGMLAAMWEAGCHPLQDDDGAPALPCASDPEARLGALLRARALLRRNPAIDGVGQSTRDRLEGVLAMFEQNLSLPTLPTDATLTYWFEATRNGDPLGRVTADDRAWFRAQIAVECMSLWNGAGEALRQLDHDLHGMIGSAAFEQGD